MCPPHLCGVVVRYWAEQTVCVVVNWEWGTCGVQMKVQGSPAVVWSSNSMSDVCCTHRTTEWQYPVGGGDVASPRPTPTPSPGAALVSVDPGGPGALCGPADGTRCTGLGPLGSPRCLRTVNSRPG
eukprot:gene15540-biopygen21720